jgi:Mg-chelatase subunit ChlD/ABC-type molybdate transport system substrate-binding protein
MQMLRDLFSRGGDEPAGSVGRHRGRGLLGFARRGASAARAPDALAARDRPVARDAGSASNGDQPRGSAGRHRDRILFGFGWPRIPVAVGGGLAAVLLGVVALRFVSASAAGCAGGVPLRIAATPEIAAVLTDIADGWMATDPKVDGQCVNATVESVPSPTIASRLTVYAGKGIDIAAQAEPTAAESSLPAVWVPDSTAWVKRVEAINNAAFAAGPESIASSPIVLAMPEAAAKAVGWPDAALPMTTLKAQVDSGAIKLGISEPRRDTAGLVAAMLLADTIATSDDDLPSLLTTLRGVVKTSSTGELLRTFSARMNAGTASEQAVLAFDASNPPAKLAPVTLNPVTPVLDYPYAIRAGNSQQVAQAAALFHDALTQPSATAKFSAKGFRTPDGRVGPGFPFSTARDQNPQTVVAVLDPARIKRALDLWTAANSPARALLVLDLTSSMAQPAPDGTQSRAQAMVAAARASLDLLGGSSRAGLWTFAGTNQSVLPIDDLSADQRNAFDQRLANLPVGATDQSGLYAAMLAGYKALKDGYDPGRPNLMIVLTDGGDSDASAKALAQFDQSVQMLADQIKPVRVVLVGIGTDAAGAANLQAIAHVVGGGYAPLASPAQIEPILLTALLQAVPSRP